jgi:hypothetical protein
VRHEDERDRRVVEDDVVRVQPVLEPALQAGAVVTELGELDEVLELQVVDVVDQLRPLPGLRLLAGPPGSAPAELSAIERRH